MPFPLPTSSLPSPFHFLARASSPLSREERERGAAPEGVAMSSSASASAASSVVPSSLVRESFEELEKQRKLITSCTAIWKDLSEHFASLERVLQARSDSLASRRESLDSSTRHALASLHRRELSIDASVDVAISRVDQRLRSGTEDLAPGGEDLPSRLRALCRKMDHGGFFELVASKKKEVDVLRVELAAAFEECIDPAKFVINAISTAFPSDLREVKVPSDLGWACVLVLESLVPVLADPELGELRPLVTPAVKERAGEMADAWKEGLEQEGGVEGAKPSSAHTFLQHLCTFGISAKEDKDLYRKLVLAFSWRRQMPKLAISLGLGDQMSGMIEELVNKGQYLDAINFSYEAGLQEKFPPIPLLKSLLNDSKNASPVTENQSNNQPPNSNADRKKQSVIRAVIKCIEERKLEADFPTEDLLKQLEQFDKAKAEKKKATGVSAPAAKRTRASNGGPMPPAKAGRLTNTTHMFVRSPSHPPCPGPPAAAPAYGVIRNRVYGSRSPPSLRDPYGYQAEEMSPGPLAPSYPPVAAPYPPAARTAYPPIPARYPATSPPYVPGPAPYSSVPVTYPHYGSAYGNGLCPAYHQPGYYR